MVPPLEESEDGNRASFPRWGKRSVISSHFTELVIKITEMVMLLEISSFSRLFEARRVFLLLGTGCCLHKNRKLE